ncbi:MAG: hypothetical protein H6Q73_295 [Firmicutes bacterium]|nr:hypothetical protein [Bacillota bacterium]
MVEDKDYFIGKWHDRLVSNNLLLRYTAKQFSIIITEKAQIKKFDIELYFALTKLFEIMTSGLPEVMTSSRYKLGRIFYKGCEYYWLSLSCDALAADRHEARI